jgi:predicted ATPase
MVEHTLPSPPVVDALRAEQLPVEFGRFTLTAILGVGGMGRVFHAVLTGPSGFRKDVAIKVIRRRHPDDGPSAELDEEARIGGLLRHPNVVDVYDYGDVHGQPFISMEMVRGLDLARLAAAAHLEPAHIAQIGASIAAGLAHAHDLRIDGRPAGLVHRDLKPSNVIVSRDGVTKVMDFGIAKLKGSGDATQTGVAKGTPAYMSPEQARAEPVDARSDLWSLGAILYELAVGEPLLKGSTVMELMLQLLRVHDRLAAPDALAAVDARVPGLGPVVARCLAETPAGRYAHAADVEAALLSLESQLPPAASLRAVVRDVLAGGDGSGLLAAEARWATREASTATLEEVSPHNLPPLTTRFLGRDAERARIARAFETGRLVTLLGPGGTGKTRLALEYAKTALPALPRGGAWFAAVQEARTLDGFLQAVGAALGVPWSHGDAQAQVDRLGAALAGRHELLLVLDNLEQVVGAAARPLRAWLGAAPQLRVLVTSRERLRIDGEHVIDLGPLEPDAAAELFVERATTARPGFALRDGDRTHVVEIVRRLDHLPLAIELAAARVSVLPVERIADRLDQRFRLLRGRSRGASERQSTLEGAIGWSWDLLEPHEQWTLAWCSAFRGGFRLQHAEEMIDLDRFPGAPWVLDAVDALREKSLLRDLPASDGSPRFGMYESIRAYAAERLDELGHTAEARDAHARVFSAHAKDLQARLRRPDPLAASRELEEDLENLLAVFEHTEDPSAKVQVALVMARHFFRQGPRFLLQRVIEAAWAERARVDPALRARVMAEYAQVLRVGEHSEDAAQHSSAAVDLAYSLGDETLAAELSVHLAYDLQSFEGADRAVDMLLRAREDMRAARDPIREAHVMSALATALGYAKRRGEAMQMHRDALAAHEANGSQRMVGVDATAIAVHFALQGELEEAEHWLARAQVAFRATHDGLGEQMVLTNLSHLRLEFGRLDEAAQAARRALEIASRVGRPMNHGLKSNLGVIELLMGRAARARELFTDEAAQRLGKSAPYPRATLATYGGVADALDGDDEGALRRLVQGVREYEAGFSHRNVALALALASCVAARTGDEGEALALLHRSRDQADEVGGQDPAALVGLAEAQIELLRARTAGSDDAAVLRDLARARLVMVSDEPGVHVRLGIRLLQDTLRRDET